MEYRSEARICRESSLTRLFLDNMMFCPEGDWQGDLPDLPTIRQVIRSMLSIKGEFTQ
ncbi:hypothetical protein APP_28110 [Aeribacillus pallidus]|nr:hypothetical protein APP_28110 [Aeribacillus pallidus]